MISSDLRNVLFSVLPLTIFLSGCNSGTQEDLASQNMACAFIEKYQDYKTFALEALAKGESARDEVDFYLSSVPSQFSSGSAAGENFLRYYEAIQIWSTKVDLAFNAQNEAAITAASLELEKAIDANQQSCIVLGWKFEPGWRS